MQKHFLSLPLWIKLIHGLRIKGGLNKESGAFLLSNINSNKISKIAFYDEFDETVSDSGIIQFKGANKLFQFLADNKLEVIMDIHTHPTTNTRQSISDRKHPMIRLKGHIALIAPSYAKNRFLKPSDCSAYEYLGEFKWRNINNPIKITLF